MEPAEVLGAHKSSNEKSRVLSVHQTTEELETWKLNERQQLLVDASGLGNLIHMAGLVIDRLLLMAFCELWSKETNTARFHNFEMAPSLRDVAYILGVPVVGHMVTTSSVVDKSVRELCLEHLGRIPGFNDCRGSHVKLSWLRSKFGRLSEHPTEDEIMYSTRAYLLCLIGSTLFPERERGYVSPKYLPLLSDFDKIREYAWGAAALAHLYKSLSLVVMPSSRKRLFGSAALLMGWIYEYIPMMRPDMEDTRALIFPRVRKWIGNRISKPTMDVSDIQSAFSMLRVSDVNWEPYRDMDPASIPMNCIAPDNVCFSRTWLISFHIREIYVPDRYARQFGQEQHPLNFIPIFQRHQWSASVDWSLEYASEIKHFQQLIGAAHVDHTRVNPSCTTAEAFTPAVTTRTSLGLSLLTMVKDIKKEFPIIERFLMRQPLPDDVARAVARVHELVESSYSKEGDGTFSAPTEGSSEPHELVALNPPVEPAHKQAMTGTLQDPETGAPMDEVPHEARQSDDLTTGKNVAECIDVNTKEAVCEGGVDSEEEEHHADVGGCREQKRRWRTVEGRGELRRSNRHCVQIKRFKHRGGKGSKPSDPILL